MSDLITSWFCIKLKKYNHVKNNFDFKGLSEIFEACKYMWLRYTCIWSVISMIILICEIENSKFKFLCTL